MVEHALALLLVPNQCGIFCAGKLLEYHQTVWQIYSILVWCQSFVDHLNDSVGLQHHQYMNPFIFCNKDFSCIAGWVIPIQAKEFHFLLDCTVFCHSHIVVILILKGVWISKWQFIFKSLYGACAVFDINSSLVKKSAPRITSYLQVSDSYMRAFCWSIFLFFSSSGNLKLRITTIADDW